MSEYNMSEHDKERPNNKDFFYIYNNKYIAKIEWNEEDNLSENNLYIGTLISELRSYRDLAPIRDIQLPFEILFIFMEKIIMK